jgi:hypothetical protein
MNVALFHILKYIDITFGMKNYKLDYSLKYLFHSSFFFMVRCGILHKAVKNNHNIFEFEGFSFVDINLRVFVGIKEYRNYKYLPH